MNYLLRKGKFQSMRSSSFQLPSEQSLALMNVPPYREVLETPVKSFFRNLFGKSENLKKTTAREEKKGETVQADEPAKSSGEKEKKPFWQTMKEIFKKKDK